MQAGDVARESFGIQAQVADSTRESASYDPNFVISGKVQSLVAGTMTGQPATEELS